MDQALEDGQVPQELYQIVECFGELLEDMELDCDTVD